MSGTRGESGRAAAWVVAAALAVALGALLLLRARSASQATPSPASSAVGSLPAPEPEGPVSVQVEPDDTQAMPASLLVPELSGAVAERRLSGRVHDPSGAPIAGAAVVVLLRSKD